MKKRGLFLILVLIVSILLNGCIPINKPEDTIYNLEAALNDYDIEKALECFEPSVQKIYAGMVEVGSSFFGVDIDSLAEAASGIANVFGDDMGGGGMPKVHFTINSKEKVSNKEVLMNVTITLVCNGQEESKTMDVKLVYIDRQWYISSDCQFAKWLL